MALLDDYRIYLKEQGKAKNTIQTYSRHVDEYCRWYRDTFGEELTLLYHTNILDFRSYLQNVKRLKFKSIDTKLSSLSSFNEFLIKSGIQEDLVIMREDRLKFQQEIASPADIEKEEVDAFLQKVLVNTGKRNYAIATVLAYAGLRVSECINISLRDMDLQARELLVIGKGNKQRIVFINDKIIHAVREYLKERNSQSEYMFISSNGGKLHRSSVNRFFNQCSDKITPHSLRHYFCSRALEMGYTMAEVSNQAGHASERTTAIYTNASRQKMKEKANLL